MSLNIFRKTPSISYKKEVETALRNVSLIMCDSEKSHLLNKKPSLPHMYANPKIHKPGRKMRLIINCRSSPMYNLAKWLVNRFKLFEKYSSKIVKNSKEVAGKLVQYNIEKDERLVSFDVVSLFSSVPVDKSIRLLKDWLTDNKVSEERIREYLELVNIVVRQTAFSFNDMMYQQ